MPDKSIAEKLLIKALYKILIENAPQDYIARLGDIPSGATISSNPPGAI